MSYFEPFPFTTFGRGPSAKTVTNILRHVDIQTEIIGDPDNLSSYTIQGGDTPEIVSQKIYGTPNDHWLLLLANRIMNPMYEWALHGEAFEKHLAEKYGDVIVFLADETDPTLPCSIPIVRGDTVFVSDTSVDGYGNRSYDPVNTALVVSYDRTLDRLSLKVPVGSAFFANTDDILGFVDSLGVVRFATAKKVPVDPLISAHHFEVAGASVDPLANVAGIPLGQTSALGITTDYPTTMIGAYKNGTSTYSVSIRDHEITDNDAKRTIRIIPPADAARVKEAFERLMRGE